MSAVLIVDDERSMRRVLATFFKRKGLQVAEASGVTEAIKKLQHEHYDAVITDLKMDDGGGVEVLRAVKKFTPATPVIVLTGYATIGSAVEVMKLGAFDYLTKPFEPDELLLTIHKALEQNGLSSADLPMQAAVFLGQDPQILALWSIIERVAPTDTTVLISGESGTGKELVACWIQARSRRSHTPLVVVDIPSVPVSLFESELFGHERGAFTGASQQWQGKLAEADGGTLFLDEVGELPLEVQAKLLRFLQDRQVTMIGGSQTRHVDARVISATNRDLAAMVDQGTFRRDLFYRLNVVQIEIPPLRERQGDIPLLVAHFVEQFSRAMGTTPKEVAPELLALLVAHAWPGNVRELENVMKRACTLTVGDVLTPASLPPYIPSGAAALERGDSAASTSLADKDRHYILEVLGEVQWNMSRAARVLGIHRATLYRKLLGMGLKPESLRQGRPE
jgi:DNA-binding NtrC family response regulator